jgi:hypothetical protein
MYTSFQKQPIIIGQYYFISLGSDLLYLYCIKMTYKWITIPVYQHPLPDHFPSAYGSHPVL